MLLDSNPEGEHPPGEADEIRRFSMSATQEQGGRAHQEDRFLVREYPARHRFVAAVADGVGSSVRGEEAATIATQELSAFFEDFKEEVNPAVIRAAIERARNRILKEAPDSSTTLSGVVRDGDRVFFFHLGDSRIYRVGGGRVTQITTDHTRAEDVRAHGGVLADESEADHLTKALERFIFTPDIDVLPLMHGDTLLLMTDGAWRTFEKEDKPLSEFVKQCPKGKPLADFLTELLRERQRSSDENADNATIIAITHEV